MTTASWQFLGFSALVALLWHLSSRRTWRDVIMLLANAAFLVSMSAEPAAYIPYAIFLVSGFCAVKIIARLQSGRVMGVLVTVFILGFCWLKRYWFLAPLGFLHLSYLTIGLSYVFFRVLHLMIDAKDDPQIAAISPLSFVNYTLNFTCLIAGPIQRYEDFARPVPALDLAVAGRAVERIAIGLFKVICLATLLSSIHDRATRDLFADALLSNRWSHALISICAYPVYLYCNFSGYVDIVIGVARFIGLELPENFNRPFAALNFIDFWGRYHMTLSNWLKFYVYTPFLQTLMSRSNNPRLDPIWGALAFFVTFFLVGIWHGPTLMFAVYGLLLGLGMSANKLYQVMMSKVWGRSNYRELASKPWYQALARGLTFTWYAISMVCFWADAQTAVHILRLLGTLGTVVCGLGVWALATIVLTILEALRGRVLKLQWGSTPILASRYVRTAWVTVVLFLCVATAALTESAAPEIVYRAF